MRRTQLFALISLAAVQSASAETIILDGFSPGARNSAQVYDLAQHYRTVEIEHPNVVDILPVTTKQVRLMVVGYGSSKITFYDENRHVTHELKVEVAHQLRLITTGPRHAATSFYLCRESDCEFVTEDRFELPATRTITEAH